MLPTVNEMRFRKPEKCLSSVIWHDYRDPKPASNPLPCSSGYSLGGILSKRVSSEQLQKADIF